MTFKFKTLRKETKRLISFKYSQYLKSLSDKLKTNPKNILGFSLSQVQDKKIA